LILLELVPNADDRQEIADIVINEQNNNLERRYKMAQKCD
jgi:hypothetical protein